MLIKYFKSNPALYFDKDSNSYKPVNPVIGSTIQHIDENELISKLQSLQTNSNAQKGANGMIWFYHYPSNSYTNADEMRKSDSYKSCGLGFMDFDHVNDVKPNLATDILSHWTQYSSRFPSLFIGMLSSSQNGLHIITVTRELSEDEYATELIRQYSYFVHLVKDIEGVDIAVKNSEGKDIVDKAGCNLTQRMFLNHSDILQITPYPAIMDWGKLENMKAFKKKFGIPESLSKKLNNIKYKQAPDELKVDTTKYEYSDAQINLNGDIRHFDNNERMYLFSSLLYLYDRDQACAAYSRIIDHMEEGKHSRSHYLNETKHWEKRGFHEKLLKECGVEFEKHFIKTKTTSLQDIRPVWKPQIKENVYEIEQGRYLSDYLDIIEKEIESNKKLVIKGNTGIGKTVAISKLAKQLNAIVIVPFLSLRHNYDKNQMVVESIEQYSRNGSYCMVYDRFAKMDNKKLTGKIIFVDESHILFLDRNYRDALIDTYKKLNILVNEYDCKVVYISATPTREAKGIKVIEFAKPRTKVNVKVYKVKSSYNTINKMIESGSWMADYNRVLVFSNQNARRFKDNHMYMNQSDLSIIHKDYEWTGDLERIAENDTLDSDVTVATSLAFNGLNFKNKDEKVLVISDLSHDSASWEVIQQCGRMRNSIVDVRLIWPDTKQNKETVDDKRDKAIAYKTLDDCVYQTDDKMSNSDTYCVMKDIEAYLAESSGLNNILNDLEKEGYFEIDDDEVSLDNSGRVGNDSKKQADTLVRGSRDVTEFASKNIENYYLKMKSQIENLEFIFGSEPVCKLMNQVMNRSIETICKDVKKCFTISNYNDDEWSELNCRVDNAIMYWKSENDVVARDLSIEQKKNDIIRKQYIECKDSMDVVDTYVELYIKKQQDGNVKRSQGNKGNTNANKSGVVTIKKTNEKIRFETIDELKEKLSIGTTAASNLIKKGKTKYYSVELY